MKTEPSFNISLTDFLHSHLRDNFSVPLSLKLAETIDHISKGSLLCYVQFTSFDGVKLQTPILWRYNRWKESSEKWTKDKIASEKARQEKYLFDYNVKRVQKKCVEFMSLDIEKAYGIAYIIVRHNKTTALKMLEIELATKI